MANELLYTPDTTVIEMILQDPIGSDLQGENRILNYLHLITEKLNRTLIGQPKAHLSSKYGFSGFGAYEGGLIVHLYAWDNVLSDSKTYPFLSVDFFNLANDQQDSVVKETLSFFGGIEHVVKKMSDIDSFTIRDLAPSIIRQRLALAGNTKNSILTQDIVNFPSILANKLDMVALAKPVVTPDGKILWVHWETSGAIMYLEDDALKLGESGVLGSSITGRIHQVVYTCKPFDPLIAEKELINLGVSVDFRKSF